MKEKDNKNLHLYQLVRYDEPTPILPEKKAIMTEKEAHARNQGLALNFAKQRYVKLEESVS
jgi:hypothetical protein